jgi:hypothetical protein
MPSNNSLFIKIYCAGLLLMASSVVASAQGRISLTGRVTDQIGAGVGKLERYAPTIFFAVKNLADDTFIVDWSRGIMVGIPRLVQERP